MRYNQIDAQMQGAPKRDNTLLTPGEFEKAMQAELKKLPLAQKTEADRALAEFLATRRAAKPRVRYLDRMNLYRISGRGFQALGTSIESAYYSWSRILMFQGDHV